MLAIQSGIVKYHCLYAKGAVASQTLGVFLTHPVDQFKINQSLMRDPALVRCIHHYRIPIVKTNLNEQKCEMTRGGHNVNSMKAQYALRLSLKECTMPTDLQAHMLVWTKCLRKFCFSISFSLSIHSKRRIIFVRAPSDSG